MVGPTFYAVVCKVHPFGEPGFEVVDEASLSRWPDDALSKFNEVNSIREKPVEFLRLAEFKLAEVRTITPA